MMTKQVINMHFDNANQRNKAMETYKNEGYEILRFGEEKDFYFSCRKMVKNNCKYCTGDVNNREFLLHNGNLGVYIDGNDNLTGDDEFGFESIPIKYCPICGREL